MILVIPRHTRGWSVEGPIRYPHCDVFVAAVESERRSARTAQPSWGRCADLGAAEAEVLGAWVDNRQASSSRRRRRISSRSITSRRISCSGGSVFLLV